MIHILRFSSASHGNTKHIADLTLFQKLPILNY